MFSIAALPGASVDAGLSKYLVEIRKFPLLKPEQELAYARRWREHRDRDAAYHLVTSHLRLVAKIAMRYRGYGLPIAEIVSEGNIGLMQAVKRFDPDRGVRLATYAMWWIRASIQEYILRSWSLVKIAAGPSQKKLFFKLRRAKSAISALQDGDLRPEQVRLIAERLKVAERDVVAMDRRLRGDASLNVPIHDEDEAGQTLDWLVDPAPTSEITLAEEQEAKQRRLALANALANLNPRERNILTARWLNEESATLEELAAEYGVSRERVRQIEERAFQKVKAAMLTSRHEVNDSRPSRAKEMRQGEART
ncbi:RNA polymerase sigma factor RpoH [Bradyrhizobium japonicum]|uniref:RNA polymerase sigma factor RpoH n=1 Tax=Bradyrhizobium japonicum TaxID=375 RepID=UPI003B677279